MCQIPVEAETLVSNWCLKRNVTLSLLLNELKAQAHHYVSLKLL